MAKLLIVFITSALCFTKIVNFVAGDADDFDRFNVKGSVYCNTCRVQFITRLSKFLEGSSPFSPFVFVSSYIFLHLESVEYSLQTRVFPIQLALPILQENMSIFDQISNQQKGQKLN